MMRVDTAEGLIAAARQLRASRADEIPDEQVEALAKALAARIAALPAVERALAQSVIVADAIEVCGAAFVRELIGGAA
jgi:hypothetical protein